jgi:hypothetical protein
MSHGDTAKTLFSIDILALTAGRSPSGTLLDNAKRVPSRARLSWRSPSKMALRHRMRDALSALTIGPHCLKVTKLPAGFVGLAKVRAGDARRLLVRCPGARAQRAPPPPSDGPGVPAGSRAVAFTTRLCDGARATRASAHTCCWREQAPGDARARFPAHRRRPSITLRRCVPAACASSLWPQPEPQPFIITYS